VIVAADGHREAEADQECQQGQRSTQHDAKIVSHFFPHREHSVAKEVADVSCKEQKHERQNEHKQWKVHRVHIL
jgi:hypothetical protein